MKNNIKIRPALFEDLTSIVTIYNQAIRSRKATGNLWEFTVKQRVEWFKKHNLDEFPIYVAELNGEVVGYVNLSEYRSGREAMSKIAEVSFFLDDEHKRKGIGSALLEHVIKDCSRIEKNTLLAFLLDVNIESIKLLSKYGFSEWGRLPATINIDDKVHDHLIYGLKVNLS
ncbi:MAG: N-acetyltransferase family protein [Bacteroidetes bacterium]|nr:N-acetyltransferase family protein [Bacteroidota bacterium]